MNKKLMALAVAGALAVPAAAMAQVTISGGFRVGMVNHSISNIAAGAGGATATARFNAGGTQSNASSTYITDNVTQIIFQAQEDLGGGLKAIARYEWRPTIDGAGNAGGVMSTGTGNGTNFVGVESRNMGTFRVGSVATYSGAGGTGSTYTPDRALAFTSHVGISQQIGTGAIVAAGQNSALQQLNFGQGRNNNSITWNSPAWGMFDLTAVWSTQNAGNDGDMAVPVAGQSSTTRKGQAFIIAPGVRVGGLRAQYIYFDNRVDGSVGGIAGWTGAGVAGAGIAVRDIKAHKLFGTYNLGNGFELTGIWSKATLNNAYSGAGAQTNFSGGSKLSEKSIWQVGGRYITGPHTFSADYTRAGDDKIVTNAAGQTGNTGARAFSLGWMYELSKRTEVGLSYAKFTNDSNAANGPHDTANNAFGASGTTGNNAGEGYSLWGVNVTHKF